MICAGRFDGRVAVVTGGASGLGARDRAADRRGGRQGDPVGYRSRMARRGARGRRRGALPSPST
ncbi:MAG: hypothetical protein WDN24_15030 [Sphingomonas sp.]